MKTHGHRSECVAIGFLLVCLTSWCRGADVDVKRGPFPLVGSVDGPPINILAYDNVEVSPWAGVFAFDSPAHPKLVQLRQDYKLDAIVKSATTDLARALALKDWVVGAVKFGTPTPEVYRDWSAIALLDRIKNGEVIFCGQCATIFQQACVAFGMPARFIELGIPENPACHFTTEVFLREYGKWAVIDATAAPEFNCYYTVDGVPQSALEMHQRVVGGGMEKVVQVHPGGAQPVVVAKTGKSPETPAWYFYYVRWLTRCDVVANTPAYCDPENTFDRWRDTVGWVDDKTIPWEKSRNACWWIRNWPPSAWCISDPAVVSWEPTSRTMMTLRTKGGKELYVDLATGDIDVDYFQVRVNDGDWQRLPRGNTFMGFRTSRGHTGPVWGPMRFAMDRLVAPSSTVQARIVRRDGTLGPLSFVKFSNPEHKSGT